MRATIYSSTRGDATATTETSAPLDQWPRDVFPTKDRPVSCDCAILPDLILYGPQQELTSNFLRCIASAIILLAGYDLPSALDSHIWHYVILACTAAPGSPQLPLSVPDFQQQHQHADFTISIPPGSTTRHLVSSYESLITPRFSAYRAAIEHADTYLAQMLLLLNVHNALQSDHGSGETTEISILSLTLEEEEEMRALEVQVAIPLTSQAPFLVKQREQIEARLLELRDQGTREGRTRSVSTSLHEVWDSRLDALYSIGQLMRKKAQDVKDKIDSKRAALVESLIAATRTAAKGKVCSEGEDDH